jgi:hypothetical protein
MLKPAQKPSRRPLIHHPSNVLDAFGQYDASNENWLYFDDSLTQQLGQFETEFKRYIRVRPASARRSSGRSGDRSRNRSGER